METRFHITPEEAVKLFGESPCECSKMGARIAKAYIAAKGNTPDNLIFSYGICFYAGIVEGQRRERAKKRKGVSV